MRNIIYLVGQISPKFPVTYEWRKYVRQYFYGNDSKYIIDPCSNPFNKDVLKKKEYAVGANGNRPGLNLIVPKDRQYVKMSDIAILNMNQYDPNKPLIGSFFELAWYYDSPEKAVIAFADDLSCYDCQHPFVQRSVTSWCNNVEEACELVDEYFINESSI